MDVQFIISQSGLNFEREGHLVSFIDENNSKFSSSLFYIRKFFFQFDEELRVSLRAYAKSL